MAQNLVVNELVASGERLIAALAAAGFEIRVAFWAKPTEDGEWFLYLASPMVDDQGPKAAYHLVHGVMRGMGDPWIEPLEVKVVGVRDSLAEDALKLMRRRGPAGSDAVGNRKPFPGMTWFGGSTLAGIDFDGGCVYPPSTLGVSA